MLYLRLDQALELLRACEICELKVASEQQRREMILKQKLAVRYPMLNGLSPMEIVNGRIELLDPVDCELFLPRRHWKNDEPVDIDPETVRLQIMYSGSRKKGPLLRSHKTKGHFTEAGLWQLVKRIAARTNIYDKEKICPLVLKRTFGRFWLRSPDEVKCPHCGKIIPSELINPPGSIATLQKAFSHKHLWSTAHYLRFNLDDVRRDKTRMLERIGDVEKTKSVRPVP